MYIGGWIDWMKALGERDRIERFLCIVNVHTGREGFYDFTCYPN